MATVPQIQFLDGPPSIASGTTTYLLSGSANGTEANRKVRWRTAGSVSRMELLVSANTIATSATTVVSRVNGANGNISVSVAAGSTGRFSDTTHSDSLASGDDYNLQVTTPATSGSLSLQAVSFAFSATSGTVERILNRPSQNNANNVTTYSPLCAGDNFNTTETAVQLKAKTAGTAKNLFSRVASNPRSTSTTLRTRLNGANGSQSFSIGAGVSGVFEDTSNTDTLAAGDLYCYQAVMGASGELMDWGLLAAVDFVATGASMVQQSSSTAVNANLTRYLAAGGGRFTPNATESNAQVTSPVTGTYGCLGTQIPSNGVTATSTLRTRVNGANGAQAVSITASTSGYFEDTTNSDSVTTSDLLCLQLVTGATGTSLLPDTTQLLFSAPQTLSPTAAAAAWVANAPTMTPGADTLSPTTAGAQWSAVDPGLQAGAVSLSPGAAVASWLANAVAYSASATLSPLAATAQWLANDVLLQAIRGSALGAWIRRRRR